MNIPDYSKIIAKETNIFGNTSASSKKKRKTLTAGQKMFFWEHPKLCSKICSICHERITKMSDLELDHTRAYSKGGTKLAFAHKLCNRIKGSGSLGKAQKMLGIKTKRKKVKAKSKPHRTESKQDFGILGFNPNIKPIKIKPIKIDF